MAGETIESVLRDFQTNGVPGSGKHEIVKSEFRNLLNAFLGQQTGANAGALIQTSKAGLDALAPAADTMAWVLGDADPDRDGVYQYAAGTWTRRGPLPYGVIHLNNAGAGTGDAIEVTTAFGVPDAAFSALYVLNVVEANTGPVTVSINGGAPKPVVNSTGSALDAGSLQPGAGVIGLDDGTNIRLFLYGDVEAILAAAEQARDDAQAAAAAAQTFDPANYVPIASSAAYYETTAAAAAEAVPLSAPAVHVNRFVSGSEFAPDIYIRSVAEPTNARKFQDTAGQWWAGVQGIDFVSLHKFDLRGTGVDESAKLQSAVSSGESLLVPIGEFVADGTVNLLDDTTIFGLNRWQSKLKLADDARAYIFAAANRSGIELHNFYFNGNRAAQTGEKTGGFIELDTCTDCSLEGLVGKDAFNAGALLRSCADIGFHRNIFDGIGSHALSIAGVSGAKCERIQATANRVRHTDRSAFNISHADHCSLGDNVTYDTGRNEAEDTGSKGASIRITNDSRHNVVTGHTAELTYRGVQFGDDTGTNGEVMYNVVSDFTFRDCDLQGALIQGPHNKLSDGKIFEVGKISDGFLHEGVRIADGNNQATHDVEVSNVTIVDTGGRMSYGISDEGTSGQNNKVDDNKVEGAVTAPYRVHGHHTVTVNGNRPTNIGTPTLSGDVLTIPDQGNFFSDGTVGTVGTLQYPSQGREVTLRVVNAKTWLHNSGNLRTIDGANIAHNAGALVKFVASVTGTPVWWVYLLEGTLQP